ncbi:MULTISPECIES: hypothetical protein [unclassified Idiomarina]|uniref:hypothetical protein n=1 Tax=unclassified Idiomarina TaxID=2614829 RepID=UPI000C8C5A10|nr:MULTISPECIES: hypothetical protein [unclassified Idiomarina]MAD53396.1 hypothetical protein [Idiomarinaceae bacterium]
MINELEISEGAYFYRKKPNKQLSNTAVSKIFRDLSKDRMTRSVTLQKIRDEVVINGHPSKLSICVFKIKSKPSFFKNYIEDEHEIKFCYIVVFEYRDYIVISKKNVSSSTDLDAYLDDVDYSTLSRLYADSDSKFHKLALDNLDVSDSAIRSKSLEARALEDSYSTFGANNYAVRNMRITSRGHLYSLTLSTARINRHNGKVSVQQLREWMADVCNDIENFSATDSFIDSFALPISFEDRICSLTPNGILLKLNSLVDATNEQSLVRSYIKADPQDIDLELGRYITKYDQFLDIEADEGRYFAVSSRNKYLFNLIGIEIKILKKSIKIKSNAFRSILLEFASGETQSLEEYINKNHCFVITFDNPEVAYNSKKLFENTQLLSNISSFMSIFEPCEELSDASSEKGIFSTASVSFSPCSIFNKVENVIDTNSTYLFLDDLGNEWADHISVSDGIIEFYHSKSGDEGLSASKFQDVVGQAQKNLGNLVPPHHRIDGKRTLWSRTYIAKVGNQSVDTNISRLRKSPADFTIDDGLEFYKKQTRKPNLRKAVYLVVNFISKSRLENNLTALQMGNQVERRNEVIQILWFISSLISSCKEQGTEIKIICLR